MAERTIKEIDFSKLIKSNYYPSPVAWEDQVLYFLMLDRFSDNNENKYLDNQGNLVSTGSTLLFEYRDKGNAVQSDAERNQWFEAGGRFVGGTLMGLSTKIGYLKRLGISAIWISPIFKQVSFQETYHGYGIQHFLDIDQRFGTREDLQQLVKTAHEHGIYIILDIILNHTGDVFDYHPDRYDSWDAQRRHSFDPRWDGRQYSVKGFRDQSGYPELPFKPIDLTTHAHAWPDGAVWPAEFQSSETFTQKGRINNWDYYPEYVEGDFCSLKDIHLGQGTTDHYQPSTALLTLCDVYKFWIGFADIDGYRVDTVKHMDAGATRFFTSNIHEYAQSLGKENFYLIGEITGGRENAFTTLEMTGLNAALGINDIPDKLEYLVKGYRSPEEYFNLFRNSLLVQKESHVWFKNRVVTTIDDHDQVRKGQNKARFCHEEALGHASRQFGLNALAILVTTLGIPCIYYGSEQGFDGHGNNDRYLREAMFGGEFGAFESKQRHFFNEEHPIYQALRDIINLRKAHIELRRGRQYLRPISGNGIDFGLPKMIGERMQSVIAWSRIFSNKEIVLAINTDPDQQRCAWVTIDDAIHDVGDRLTCLYSTHTQQITQKVYIEAKNGKAVELVVPAAGFVMYQ